MDLKTILTALKAVLELVIPYIKQLIKSQVVPKLKRKAYEKLNSRADALIEDLAQNAAKIADEPEITKQEAYIEGTKLGLETLRAIAEKLNKAADTIEDAIR